MILLDMVIVYCHVMTPFDEREKITQSLGQRNTPKNRGVFSMFVTGKF